MLLFAVVWCAAFKCCHIYVYVTRHPGSEYEPVDWRRQPYGASRTAHAGAHGNHIAGAVSTFVDLNPQIGIDIYYCRIKSGACCAATHHKCVLSPITRKMVGFIAAQAPFVCIHA
jgi:hypothetical protein